MRAVEYKSIHGGYPTMATMQLPADHSDVISQEIVASESPRKSGFNYGVGWETAPKPSIYFDAVRLNQAMRDDLHERQSAQWRLETAMRNLRLAETVTEKVLAIGTLRETMDNLASSTAGFDIRMAVNDLANTIDDIAPEPLGYVPHMGLHHAMHPVRKLVEAFKKYLSV